MYTEFDYDFDELELPNILLARKKGVTKETVELHPFMQPLLLKLAKARPNWRLIASHSNFYTGNQRVATTFEVFEGHDLLGTVSKSYNYGAGTDVFSIDNTRMSNRRKRGSSTTTKDVTKAFKIITKEFHGKTNHELLVEAATRTSQAVSTYSASRHNNKNNNIWAITQPALDYVMANWEAFCAASKGRIAAHVIEGFFAGLEEAEAAARMYEARQRREGYTIVLRGTDYLIHSGETTEIRTSDQLSPHLRRAIGLLKIANTGTAIPDIGVKASDTEMFVMPEPQGETRE